MKKQEMRNTCIHAKYKTHHKRIATINHKLFTLSFYSFNVNKQWTMDICSITYLESTAENLYQSFVLQAKNKHKMNLATQNKNKKNLATFELINR